MAPNNIVSSAAAKLDATPSPPRSDRTQVRRPGTAKSIRTLSTSSIPTLSSSRSPNAPPISASPSPSRRPVRSGVCPSSSRPGLANAAALDSSQDHHRSDSGRSTGSSRSTATTDSFFLPQHPHLLHRRFKDLPNPPSSSALVDVNGQAGPSGVPASALSLDVAIDPSASSALLPSAHLHRSKSSVSTTPTSPEEGNGSSLGAPDFSPLENDDKLMAQGDGLDDFWQSDYSYARPSVGPLQATLPPLMRSDVHIPPSRSQSLDPLAAPLDGDSTDNTLKDGLLLQSHSPSIGPATPLVAANLQKLNLQNDQSGSSPVAVLKLSSPVLSSLSGAPTPTKRSDDGRPSMPRVSPYQQLVTPASPSSSAVDPKSQPSKSSSSLSSSSAHDHDKVALASSSKRSSTSSSSSFRMTLSRQAKTLRHSFMWTPPTSASTPSTGQEHVAETSATLNSTSSSTPISQASSPSSASVNSPQSTSNESASTNDSSRATDGLTGRQGSRRTVSAATSGTSSSRVSHSSSYIPQSKPVESKNRPGSRLQPSASRPSVAQSPKSRVPTDYSKSGDRPDRPKSRLSSRLMLQNASWSMKMPHLTTKKPKDATVSRPAADAGAVAADRRSKSQAAALSSSSAPKAAGSSLASEDKREAEKQSALVPVSELPGPLPIAPTSLLGGEGSGAAAQISPSFAATFAFLNSQIESPKHSPPLVTTVLPTTKAAQALGDTADQKARAAFMTEVRRVWQEKSAGGGGAVQLLRVEDKIAPVLPQTDPQTAGNGDTVARVTLFDRLADSPEAVYKTLALPEFKAVPASQSLGNVAAGSDTSWRKSGHKKHASLGSAALISKSARAAAADLDKRANASPTASSRLPSTNGRISTSSSFVGVLPTFTPLNEEACFFDALTSPFNEQPSDVKASESPDESILPTFATAREFPSTGTEPSSPVLERARGPGGAAVTAAKAAPSQLNRTSLGRRLSGVFDASKARSTRRNQVASPPQSPRAEFGKQDALPTRPETSLGFHLRNPLRRERKASLKTAEQSLALSAKATQDIGPGKEALASSAVRTSSSNLNRADPVSPPRRELPRSGTSLGFATPGGKTIREFSSRITAPTKSSLARSVQPSPPSAARPSVRSASASSPSTVTSGSISRSPQRPANPPSSFRGSPAARLSVYANESPSKSTTAVSAFLSRRRQSSAIDAAVPLISNANQDTASQTASGPTIAPPSSPTDIRRRTTTMGKPVLNSIRTSFAEEPVFARPSTATGFRGTLTSQDRKMSQPTLDMVDDREFLEALEQVRAVQRERIQAQAQEVENKTRLARLGMMSGNHLKTKSPVSMLGDGASAASPTSTSDGSSEGGFSQARTSAEVRFRHKRSASADAKLSPVKSTNATLQQAEEELDQRQKDIVKAYADKAGPVSQPTSGLEWGVGKASGKLHDGTFVNDDDWKKEVKALFLIRELVQTERSYARHLSSLLSVVSKMQMSANGSSNALSAKRKSTSNLFAAYSSAYTSKTSASAPPPSHIALLRTYLPQLIALSNSLVQRVEDNPTSAGVGAAFDVLSAELESTFVGWSSVASQALKDLRQTEQAKAKSPYKIGLVPLMPRESSEVGASTGEASSSSGHSSPASGIRNSTLRMTSLTRPASPVAARQETPTQSETTAQPVASRSTKRRSTITSTSFIPPPRVVIAPAPPTTVFSSSPEQEKALDRSLAAAPSRRFGHSRSQSTVVTPLQTPTSAIAPDSWPTASKSLTPMDIAIMPTQRIPRYGLMLRDLLRNTPPESLSHARVQRAISLIQKVALLCDSAAPEASVKTAPSSGATTPLRAAMTPAEAQSGVLLGSAFGMTRRT